MRIKSSPNCPCRFFFWFGGGGWNYPLFHSVFAFYSLSLSESRLCHPSPHQSKFSYHDWCSFPYFPHHYISTQAQTFTENIYEYLHYAHTNLEPLCYIDISDNTGRLGRLKLRGNHTPYTGNCSGFFFSFYLCYDHSSRESMLQRGDFFITDKLRLFVLFHPLDEQCSKSMQMIMLYTVYDVLLKQ